MKLVKRSITLVLVFIMLGILSVPAFARASDEIRTCKAVLSLKADGDLNIFCSITTNNVMETIGLSSITIQRYSGSRWISEYTFTICNTAGMQSNDARTFSKTLTYTPQYLNSTYRAVVNFNATGSLGSYSADYTTEQVTT